MYSIMCLLTAIPSLLFKKLHLKSQQIWTLYKYLNLRMVRESVKKETSNDKFLKCELGHSVQNARSCDKKNLSIQKGTQTKIELPCLCSIQRWYEEHKSSISFVKYFSPLWCVYSTSSLCLKAAIDPRGGIEAPETLTRAARCCLPYFP